MEGLPLAGVLGAAVGVGVGLIDYGIVAGLVRKGMAGRDPSTVDRILKIVFVANALAFAALGWWFGTSVAGTGL